MASALLSLLPIIALLVFFFLILLAFAFLSRKRGADSYPYQQQEQLFTPAEWRFYQVLRQAVPEGVTIFGKVRGADVLKPEKGLDRSTWQKSFNKIAMKHFDFVLAESDSGRMFCAIELNDRSHQRRDRQERDAFLVGACENAKFPLLMVPTAKEYDAAALLDSVQRCIAGEAQLAANDHSPNDGNRCPRCGSPLVEKTARRGKNAGGTFLSCADFPRCKYSRAL
jgi:hypothetical protein